ncbi:MAG TPA: lysoplasmalogenase [Rhodocyclaceae bacterium]|nr:lysoplasmalogenase [Rhodocyclaceae bacterium]
MAIASALAGDPGRWIHYIAKPATTFLVLARAWFACQPFDVRYRVRVAIALVFCAGGDIFLMLPLAQGFMLGLASFLVGHLWFIAAAVRGARFAASPWPFVAYGLVAGAILAVLWPSVPQPLQLPVLAYVAVLTAMAAQGAVRHRLLRTPSTFFLAIGGACFLCSDSLLAWDRFAGALPLGRLWVLGSYYLAIWFIARSISGSAATGQ